MNLHVLEQSVTQNLNILRPIVDNIFDDTIEVASRTKRSVNLNSFVKRMNVALKGTQVRVVTQVSTTFDDPNKTQCQYYPAMGGICYEPLETHKTRAKIRIILIAYPGVGRLSLSPDAWEYFRYRFLKTLCHELVHRAQFSRGRTHDNKLIFRPHAAANLDKTILREQEYLGDIDEVEAYAHDCVEEWHYIHPERPLTSRQIKQVFQDHGGKIPALQFYYETYNGDTEHPCVRRLFRKVKDWHHVITPLAKTLPPVPSYVMVNTTNSFGVALQ